MIKGARQILQPAQFQQFGTMEEAKDELMAMERVLLQTIKFDFNIEHAHKFIIQVFLLFFDFRFLKDNFRLATSGLISRLVL